MTNREIASMFNELAVMLELHEENEFKIKTYANAYLALRKLDINLLEQSKEENKTIRGSDLERFRYRKYWRITLCLSRKSALEIERFWPKITR